MHGWITEAGKQQLNRILEAGTVCRTYVDMSAPLPDHVPVRAEEHCSSFWRFTAEKLSGTASDKLPADLHPLGLFADWLTDGEMTDSH